MYDVIMSVIKRNFALKKRGRREMFQVVENGQQ